MTGVLVALLAVLWAVVLLPVLLKAKEDSSVSVSVGTFSRGMRALGSNHDQPSMGGRWVLTPRSPLDERTPSEIIFMRRRIFCGLLAALAFTLPASLVPGLHFLVWVSILLATCLAGFTAFLISEKNKRDYRPLPIEQKREWEEPRFRADDIPSVLRIPEPSPVRILHHGGRPLYVIDDETLPDDDGLSELGWAQAGRY
ncbi:MAG TPA: hypothetical protein VHJ78_10715 [Actinomycetota bacterium]|nr:hypothetical protein [Actinomycetota bacterium]